MTLDAVKSAIAFDQPKLVAIRDGRRFIVRGAYLLFERSIASHPDGPMTEFLIEIQLPDNYPRGEPRIFETGNRIPWIEDRHVNRDGNCCVTVWEHWLACTEDNSLQAYLNGPVYEFFLSQYLFEKTGRWPFGERPHGIDGLIEAYAESLGIESDPDILFYHLRLLAKRWPKGHWLCPCRSGKIVRTCHKAEMAALHDRIPSHLAARMLQRMKRWARTRGIPSRGWSAAAGNSESDDR